VHPGDQSIFAGESATYRVTISRIGRFNSPIDLMLISPENDFPTSAVPQRLKTEQTSVFVIRTSEQTQPKSYHFNIFARAHGNEKIVPISLEVKSKNHIKEKEKEPGQFALAAEVRSSVDRLVIKETTKIRSRDPLLPYIFFEENQDILDEERYNILNPDQKRVTRFTFLPEKLLNIPSKYKNTLNVIAKRLWDNPQMEIIVRGYNSDWGVEKGSIELSRRRAEAVRNYLVNNCGVGSGQVKIEAHHLPPDPASNLDPRGREENQRVEISCPISSQPILDPIVTETSEIATSDDMCRFKISNFAAGSGLKSWKLVIMESVADTFKVFDGKVLPENDVIWDWKNDEGQSVSIGKTYRYLLHLQDKNDQTFATSWKAIQVEKVSAIEREYLQKNIEKTRLILFKYDRADMDLTSKSLREELDLNIQKLKSNSGATLLIQGHTDVIGGVDYNTKLSLRRAESVARYFTDRRILRSRVSFEGFGMEKPLMTNNLPEGRMMNRRVEIYILY
jgi:outer membrane protein OmpA-like peptidoglycan-associated protein